MRKALLARFPEQKSLIGVFATAVFITYGWTAVESFWKMPSWLFSLRLEHILGIYAYAFLVNFLESVLLLFVLVIPGLFLPRRWWNDTFLPRGVVLTFVIVGSALLHQNAYRTPDVRLVFVEGQSLWWAVTLLIGLLLAWMASRVSVLRKGLEELADRFTIFLFIYLPLTMIALVVILARIFL